MNKPINNKKEIMDINDEFLDLFLDDISDKKITKKKAKKGKKETKIKKVKKIKQIEQNNNFKDDIIVFIEQNEIADIKKILNIVDKLKK